VFVPPLGDKRHSIIQYHGYENQSDVRS